MNHDDAWHEQQYNPRLSVTNATEIIDGWRRRSMQLRSTLSPMCDFKYGSHPRENLDLFRAVDAKATLVFIHGGYWRTHSKLETAFIAEHFVERGISVALINYPLCPDVTLHDIRCSVLRAFAYLWTRLLHVGERHRVVVCGHSAGGHLAALHATENWASRNLPAHPIKAIVSLSGVFDVVPLLRTSINADLRLTPETAAALSLMAMPPQTDARMLLAVGDHEPEEFHAQAQRLAKAWSGLTSRCESIAGTNHFTIVDNFADPATQLHQQTMSLLLH